MPRGWRRKENWGGLKGAKAFASALWGHHWLLQEKGPYCFLFIPKWFFARAGKRVVGQLVPPGAALCVGWQNKGFKPWPLKLREPLQKWSSSCQPQPATWVGIHVHGPLSVHGQHQLTWLLASFPSREGWLSLHVGSVSKPFHGHVPPTLSDCLLPVPMFLGRTGSPGMELNIWQIPWAQSQDTCPAGGQRGPRSKVQGHQTGKGKGRTQG